nr:hypothetical protein [Tanacetum cinerariifolium]
MSCGEVIDDMLTIKLFMAGINEEIFTSESWTNSFNIDEAIYSELRHEFYSTYEFDEVCAADELTTKKIIKFRLCGHAFSWTLLCWSLQRALAWHLEEIHVTWAHVEKKQTRLPLYIKIHEEIMHSEPVDGVTTFKQWCHDSGDNVVILATVS